MDFNFFENDIFNQNFNMNFNKIILIENHKYFFEDFSRIFQKF
jgi:hypothetical protein